MEDFEYSVQISDRDWECFFEECEECNLLPPALAGLDDSGMSDMDDMGSILANRVQRVERTAGFLEADRPFDGPPDCEGSPVEHYLSKYGVAGMESVLSGSEEDIHLESVNTFFERLKGLTEAEKLTEPSQVEVGKNREAAQGEELCSDGPQASSSALPKNIPKLNSLPARSETAIGKETAETVNANSNINTMKKDEPDSKISPGLAASNSLFETNKSELFIRGEDWVETTENEERHLTLTKTTDEEGEGISGPKSLLLHDTTGLKCDLERGTEDAATTSEAETNEAAKAPDSKHSVYAMSSFWSEMEKLTIKDILGLRMASSSAPSSLPALPENEAADASDAADSGYFAQLDESKPDHSGEDTSSLPDFVESNSVLAIDSSSSTGVKWENELDPVSLGAGIYPENMMLTSVSDIPQPLLSSSSNSSSSSAQKYLRKMSKNASVRNLHALDSFSHMWKGQALPTVIPEEGELDSEYFTDGHMPRKDSGIDSLPSSSFTGNASTDSYRISLSDIFQYLFGGKQSNPSPSVTDNIATYYTDGNSVPETYDHFFSEFDTGSFFYPLIRATDQAKDELVPIFSCSRSTSRNLQFPEAYDHFFASSSSDDSSMESDEEADDEDRGPIRVVTRFSREANATQISTDIYENFFTDGDLGQNLFWKNTFSLRNIRLTGSANQQQRSSSLSVVPVRQSGRSLRGTIQPINALGNQDVPFPDPLLYHLEDRISRQLAQQPFRYDELQTAVSNPRLDASLMPLRQSDMCLVCIAFASWVLKSANPQVGDAWKAVLLANVSALSAIRYLRKYVRVEAAAEEKALHHTASL
ncbi:PGC-1 and ERR-induced regulator in muscle protein 1 [Centroberyx affinis]|uniref:PGC-1 and ERR-induced regulator in muscle protein 1 n=1 Tax=Centroberyx affinis TaxID=166261 RepID=UPI003A5C6B19